LRVSQDKINFLKREIQKVSPGSRVYLFGSRINDDDRGGDIDILILSEDRISLAVRREIKVAFYKVFGYQKLDIVNFCFDEEDSFKELALLEGEEI